RRSADSLAIAEVMAPYELAKSGRQDVVCEVADEQRAQHRHVPNRMDRRDETLPAPSAKEQIDDLKAEHDGQPAEACATEQLDGPSNVDLAADHDDRHGRHDDADDA